MFNCKNGFLYKNVIFMTFIHLLQVITKYDIRYFKNMPLQLLTCIKSILDHKIVLSPGPITSQCAHE